VDMDNEAFAVEFLTTKLCRVSQSNLVDELVAVTSGSSGD